MLVKSLVENSWLMNWQRIEGRKMVWVVFGNEEKVV